MRTLVGVILILVYFINHNYSQVDHNWRMIKVNWLVAILSLKGGSFYWIFLRLAYNLLDLQEFKTMGSQGREPSSSWPIRSKKKFTFYALLAITGRNTCTLLAMLHRRNIEFEKQDATLCRPISILSNQKSPIHLVTVPLKWSRILRLIIEAKFSVLFAK